MMDPATFFAFFVATTLMILLPGPSVMLSVAHSLALGWRRALICVAGCTCGVAIQLAIAVVGMASFMLLLASWFEWLRWAGVAYLVYLGIRQWRRPVEDEESVKGANSRSLFLQGLVVTIPNPKSMLFMAAFLPQFLDPAGSMALQLAVMVPTFLAITFIFTGMWTVAAGYAGGLLRSRRQRLLRNGLPAD